ncbi:uncharacterized protein H6S33_000380 [Morchella sextelata]|uniref:uncharacterized protein n=1 Tax=Morchella sextelata TaxID=1174677 RepID=UPI001D0397F5|nr:uncharacterized protein H6S33_000380 [Morchella sextelata]KAH0614744.1 hypothetical protein H6S33_000380 [Morchella sextelata]
MHCSSYQNGVRGMVNNRFGGPELSGRGSDSAINLTYLEPPSFILGNLRRDGGGGGGQILLFCRYFLGGTCRRLNRSW